MSENKFLKNLNQSAGQLPATTPPSSTAPPARRSSPAPSGADEYDPIQRLTNELSRHSRAIEGLSAQIEQMKQRPQAATQAELAALLVEARAGTNFTLDSQQVATLLLPDLQAGMPNPAKIKAAVDAGAAAISLTSTQAADRIKQATAQGASRIEGASKSRADDYANFVGFNSWKSAVAVGSLIGLIIYLTDYQSGQRAGQIAQARQETQAVREFTNWVKNQPEGKKLYERYYNH